MRPEGVTFSSGDNASIWSVPVASLLFGSSSYRAFCGKVSAQTPVVELWLVPQQQECQTKKGQHVSLESIGKQATQKQRRQKWDTLPYVFPLASVPVMARLVLAIYINTFVVIYSLEEDRGVACRRGMVLSTSDISSNFLTFQGGAGTEPASETGT